MRANVDERVGTTSVVREARRRQIVAAAIAVLAREGHTGTSLSRIAAEAGLSSAGLITYHFTDREQLLDAVVADVVGRYDAAVAEAVAAAPDARAGLAAYIDSAVRFQDRNRDDVRALWQVVWSRMESAAGPVIDKDSQLGPLVELLERGQTEGQFRADIRDPRWVAKSIHATVVGYLDALVIDPDLDAADYIEEVQRLYALATDRPSRPRPKARQRKERR
jgi:AcrR family transcriptional regulator